MLEAMLVLALIVPGGPAGTGDIPGGMGADGIAQPAPPASGFAEAEPTVPEACATDASALEEGAAASGGEMTSSCSRCPVGVPQCWRDRDCDRFCGGKGQGVCERINSCYKCCLCAAAL